VVNIHEPGPLESRLDQWPVLAVSGAMEVRLAETDVEVEAAQRLRYRVFYEEMSAVPSPTCARPAAISTIRRGLRSSLGVDRSLTDEDGQPAWSAPIG